MTDISTGIYGGLIGSILTVVITKFLDIFQSSKSHKYDLEKTFFEKKLAAAEAVTTQFAYLSSATANLSVVYERMLVESNVVEKTLQEILLKQVHQYLEVASNASLIVGNSVMLYFDISTDFNQNIIVTEYYSLLGSLGPLANNWDLMFDNYINSKGTELEHENHARYIQSEEELKKTLSLVSTRYKELNIKIQDIIKQIRDDMRRFEY